MTFRQKIILMDSDTSQRAAISRKLNSALFHIEPFEDIHELALRWPERGVLLVNIQDNSVRELAQRMVDAGIWLPIIAYATDTQPSDVVDAVLGGATGYLTWPFSSEDVEAAISRANSSGAEIGSTKAREGAARSRLKRLTPREREVLAAVAQGLSNRLIARTLDISPRTVEIHRANMLHKIGARHTSEAIRVALEASLVT